MPGKPSTPPSPRVCLQCGAEFIPTRKSSTGRHCSKACWNKTGAELRAKLAAENPGKRRYPTRECAGCGKLFELKRYDTYGKYCSRTCSDPVSKNGVRPQEVDNTCLNCGEPFRTSSYYTVKDFCSNRCGGQYRARTVVGANHPLHKPKVPMACTVCGKVVLVKPSLVSRFRACSRQCTGALSVKAQSRISGIERKMAAAFREVGLTATPQYRRGHWTFDFAFPESLTVVECDGKYWHSLPKRVVKDAAKTTYIETRGWTLIRLGEDEINADPIACAHRVAARLHGASSIPPDGEHGQLTLPGGFHPTLRNSPPSQSR